jgi:RNA polymerase sigma factor (sigma-70 family)
MLSTEFEELWRRHREQILRTCVRIAGGFTHGEELFQQVALRAWRGYPTFRHDASFLTWAICIAQRTAASFFKRRLREKAAIAALAQHRADGGEKDASNAPLPSDEAKSWLAEALDDAVQRKWLQPIEAVVLRSRCEMAETSNWETIAEPLQITPGNAAVIHCRAVMKYRVYLFLFRKQVFGGDRTIKEALSVAQEHLSDAETRVFQNMVLEESCKPPFRKWETELRSACAKVARFLPTP